MATTETTKPSKNGKSKAPPNLSAHATKETDAQPRPEATPKWKRQTEIPGTERATIAEIDQLAATYVQKRDKRAAMQAEEKTLKAQLSTLLKKHDLTSYRYIDGGVEYEVELDITESLTVSKAEVDAQG